MVPMELERFTRMGQVNRYYPYKPEKKSAKKIINQKERKTHMRKGCKRR